jgi:zinc/manganese transport system ATP-binding protein
MASDLLRLENVSVRLGGREILRDVSFSIRPGEFTGLIGPNGAGKTTLLRVILGLQPVTSGSVLLAGAPRPSRDSSIGYVPQKLAIEPDVPLRVRDVVSLGLDGHKFGIRLPSGPGASWSATCSPPSARNGTPMRGSASCPGASSSG